jgi:hypothetical protein
MQATATVKRTLGKDIWFVAVAIALLGVLAVGVAVTAVTNDDSTATIRRAPSLLDAKTSANPRFVEMNALPEISVARPQTHEQIRWLEINILPEAATAPTVSFERMRFAEINELPNAAPAAPVAFETMRFVEINALPDAAGSGVAPSSDRLGERH